jgi:hypothetical protein
VSNIASSLYYLLSHAASVSALVGTRIYPIYAPDGSLLPSIVYLQTGTSPVQASEGNIGLTCGSFQFSCWATSYAGAVALQEALRACLTDYMGTSDGVVINWAQEDSIFDSPSISPENEVADAYGRTLLYTIFFKE